MLKPSWNVCLLSLFMLASGVAKLPFYAERSSLFAVSLTSWLESLYLLRAEKVIPAPRDPKIINHGPVVV